MTDYPSVTFEKAVSSKWEPVTNTISYNSQQPDVIWSILHEIGHMEAQHSAYRFDIQLLTMETEAWTIAKKLAKKYRYSLDDDYVQDCLDSYRDWLYKRSSCPLCKQAGIQNDTSTYKCINCGKLWKVTMSRFCRAYRKSI